MIKESIDISENDGILECTIKVPVRNHMFPDLLVYKTRNVVDLVTKRGYKVGQVLQESFVHNKNDRSQRYEGTWRFQLKPKAPPKRTTPARTRTTKTKKTEE